MNMTGRGRLYFALRPSPPGCERAEEDIVGAVLAIVLLAVACGVSVSVAA